MVQRTADLTRFSRFVAGLSSFAQEMLRAQRLLLSRRPTTIIPSALRLASSAAATAPATGSSIPSSSSLPPTSHAARTSRSLLYSVPVLPPLPPPLPYDADPQYTFLAPTSTAHNAPSAFEQLAVLNACLVSGDITRAEEVAKRIGSNWNKHHTRKPDYPALCSILPPRIHADFIRAYFSTAVAPKGSFHAVNSFSLASKIEQRAPKAKDPTSEQSKLVNKAWLYFDSLLHTQWEQPREAGSIKFQNGAIDSSVLATMLKGLVAAGPAAYDPSTLTDSEGWQRPITSLLPVLRTVNLDFLQVMKDPIFDVHLPSYLGTVTREAVLEAVLSTGNGRKGWSDWKPEIDRVANALAREREGKEAEEAVEQAAELLPTSSVRPSSSLSSCTN